MNLGGASNVDLSEAARLLKQSTAGAGVPNQQVPPPMMLMQQAVAMQQFQFQQALLMQQVMASQQAAARAATVKSAQEMAAARAAEISKQLKGNEPDVEEEKKSPGRSRSRTPSRSRSFSRSKSRSPLRYRRDRSASRSPIRYRRDSRFSPSRSRDYHSGYRGRSRRGYYRGRGEYGWNPSFRRDWDRDRDHYSSRSRRSRSRSKSRVRRRSHSRSRSPRGRRDRSVTPPRYRRDDRRSGRSSRRSKSAEAKPSPSHSSRSRSHSRSESLHKEYPSRSPPRKSKDAGSGGGSRKRDDLSPEPIDDQHPTISSPVSRDHKVKLYQGDGVNKTEESVELANIRPKVTKELSVSPARSLSVSLSPPRRVSEKVAEKLEDVNGPSDWKKTMLRDALGQRTGEVFSAAEVSCGDMKPSTMHIEGGVSSREAFLERETVAKGALKGKSGEFAGKGRKAKKDNSKLDFSSDESDGDKEVDDWRDDIKANELEKIKRMETKREFERREEEKKSLPVPVPAVEDVRVSGVTLLEHLGKGSGKVPAMLTSDVEPQSDSRDVVKMTIETLSKEYLSVVSKYSSETLVNGSKEVEEEDMQQTGFKYTVHVGVAEQEIEDARGKSPDSANEADMEGDGDVVFEGPKLAYDEGVGSRAVGVYRMSDDSLRDLGKKSQKSSKGEDSSEEIGAEQPPLLDGEVGIYKGKEKSKLREEGDTRGRGKDKARLREEPELYGPYKAKENSRSRERSHERRKDRHRKHKRKHRRDDDTEKEEEDDHKRDGDGGKDKEERRHRSSKKHRTVREHNDDRREKKKHRHKHRGKSPSESPEKDLLGAEVEGVQDVDQLVGPVYKKHAASRENRKKDVSKSPAHASGSASD